MGARQGFSNSRVFNAQSVSVSMIFSRWFLVLRVGPRELSSRVPIAGGMGHFEGPISMATRCLRGRRSQRIQLAIIRADENCAVGGQRRRAVDVAAELDRPAQLAVGFQRVQA